MCCWIYINGFICPKIFMCVLSVHYHLCVLLKTHWQIKYIFLYTRAVYSVALFFDFFSKLHSQASHRYYCFDFLHYLQIETVKQLIHFCGHYTYWCNHGTVHYLHFLKQFHYCSGLLIRFLEHD